MSCCSGIARFLLITFNFIFWLSGAAILAVGIWILVDKNLQEYLDVIKDAMGNEDALRTSAYILIGFGAFVFLVGFCGCCGAIRKSKCLLGFYILFLVIVCAGELAAGVYVAIYQGDAEDKLDSGLSKSIKENYGDKLQGAWDFVQTELKCCGGLGKDDYLNSTWYMSKSVADQAAEKIPLSCCVVTDGNTATDCQMADNTDNYHTDGCKDSLLSWVKDHTVIMIGVGCGIAALEIFGLICAICFCRHMDEDKYTSN